MALTPGARPVNSGSRPASTNAKVAGTSASADPTNEPGQYPVGGWGPSIFGGPLPTGTGAPGTQGARAGASDPTNQAGQVEDGLTGISTQQITETGAPGSSTTPNQGEGGDSITYTRFGSFLTGTYQSDTVSDELSGPQDSTQANDIGYATGGPQLPGIAGNEPQAGDGRYQPSSGRVLRGGRYHG